MGKPLKTLLVAGLSVLGMGSFFVPSTTAMPTTDMYVVMFSADWCGPCKIVEPKVKQAMSIINNPRIEYVAIDISSPQMSDYNANVVFDRNIVKQYNSWFGMTGFAAIIDADTKRTLGCVNMLYDTQSMAMHIKNLKTYADANRPTTDVTCPEANR